MESRRAEPGGDMDGATVEALAKRIHENYLAGFAPDGLAWAELSEDLREANRAQARAMAAKLATIGAGVVPGRPGGRFTFTAAELEQLARAEHDRWMQQHKDAGWTYGPVRDDRHKIHPMIVPWEDLGEAERDKDRDAVRHIPQVLASVGLRVARRRRLSPAGRVNHDAPGTA